MKIALDSDICIDILNGKISKDKFMAQYSEVQIAITSSTVFELYRGIYKDQFKKNPNQEAKLKREIEKLDRFLQTFLILPYNGKAAQKTAFLVELLRFRGEMIGVYDCQIAGTLLAHGIPHLLTQNLKHFSKIDGLCLDDVAGLY